MIFADRDFQGWRDVAKRLQHGDTAVSFTSICRQRVHKMGDEINKPNDTTEDEDTRFIQFINHVEVYTRKRISTKEFCFWLDMFSVGELGDAE